MSAALMVFQPRTDDPSKPKPSSILGQLVGGHGEVLPCAEHVDEAQVDHADLLLAKEVNYVFGRLFAHVVFCCLVL